MLLKMQKMPLVSMSRYILSAFKSAITSWISAQCFLFSCFDILILLTAVPIFSHQYIWGGCANFGYLRPSLYEVSFKKYY